MSDRPADVRKWPEARGALIQRGDRCPVGAHDPMPTYDGYCAGCLEMLDHLNDLGLL
ncbi:hypothetical protein AB0J38_14535 [Streptomyces sp. NPDC050095]|uniref:hypothetical protein n=1 Tax=unclassified Streptomyces TaxID=2593676 RepID=UPI0034481E36